ncbi:alpha-glucan family phosphorylase [candidate division KSB1 bacterium]|nr:alpha-glucan family phosphorylase [candidate division KSB1 bacterium]
MKPLKTFTIVARLPEKLTYLKDVAFNLYWSWNHEALNLFQRLDSDMWEKSDHNPVKMLGLVRQERLESLADDEGFLAHLHRVYESMQDYLNEPTWYLKTYGEESAVKIAYFSAEFGLTECVRIYSGGLGILAGDHLKSASELGIPLVGVGLLYQEGYFHQYLNADGWQGEQYPKNDFYNMPIELQRKENGDAILIEIAYADRTVKAQIWKVVVGRISLYLLDTNIEENSQEDREITDELYGGDSEMRIKQEILLGIGGIRALKAVGITPTVFHMNEGHSAFLALERIRCILDEKNLTFDEAVELTRSGNVFTTHTPVPAGIDRFPAQLMDKYFTSYYPKLNINRKKFLGLGRINANNEGESFSMAVLAIRLASHINGVSKLHGEVSRRMWMELWPNIPEKEIPITSVTNGTHPFSWISKDMASLYDRYLGPRWVKKPADMTIWKRVEQIPSEELWRTHERRRERLVAFARTRLIDQLHRQGSMPSEIERAEEVLNPEALTIGFARRFATYKRATLLFHDPVRLAHIMRNKDYPIQIIIAGKAHPKDTPGKELIRKIVHLARMEEFRSNIVFLENYDMVVSRYLVQGVDVWLNNPRRFMEASGTSGMKAAMNGVLNMSILDGWWDEAYEPNLGWAIGRGEDYNNYDYQDDVESQAMYNLLEKEVIPLFYDRGRDNIPRKWINYMKKTLMELCPVFNTNRMIREYTERFYLPAHIKYSGLEENNQARARALNDWKQKIYRNWSMVRIVRVEGDDIVSHQVGSKIAIEAKVQLGELAPEDVSVEIYHGYISTENQVLNGEIEKMSCNESNPSKTFTFRGEIICNHSGLYGYTIRVLPMHEDLANPHETGLIVWAN